MLLSRLLSGCAHHSTKMHHCKTPLCCRLSWQSAANAGPGWDVWLQEKAQTTLPLYIHLIQVEQVTITIDSELMHVMRFSGAFSCTLLVFW